MVPNEGLPISQAAKARATKAIKELVQSGPPSPVLTSDALKIVESFKRLPELVDAELSEFRCFGDGCTVTATSKETGAAAKAAEAIMRSEQFLSWPGPKFRSGPIEAPSGQIQTVVILYRNQEATSVTTHAREAP